MKKPITDPANPAPYSWELQKLKSESPDPINLKVNQTNIADSANIKLHTKGYANKLIKKILIQSQ